MTNIRCNCPDLFKKDYKLLNSLIKDKIFWYERAIKYINIEKEPAEYFENLKIKHKGKIKELEKLTNKLNQLTKQ